MLRVVREDVLTGGGVLVDEWVWFLLCLERPIGFVAVRNPVEAQDGDLLKAIVPLGVVDFGSAWVHAW